MNYFQNIPLFSGLSEADQINLSDFCQVQLLKPLVTLFSQGDEAQAMYIVLSGGLSVIQDGQKIAELGFGDIVGEMSFFGRPPVRNASVVTQEDTQVVTLLHYSLTQILEKYPNIHAHLKRIILERSQKNNIQ